LPVIGEFCPSRRNDDCVLTSDINAM
jgi:hypothetical protein